MPQNQAGKSTNATDISNWKPGSEGEKAKTVAANGDFGVPEEGRSHVERNYVSRNTKLSDPDAAKPRAGEEDGKRTTGVGTYRTSDGGGSGGDIDTDIIGVGTGGSGVSASGPDDAMDASEIEPPQPKAVHAVVPSVNPSEVVNLQEDDTQGVGADSAVNSSRNDDAFAGEVSSDEASGDNDKG